MSQLTELVKDIAEKEGGEYKITCKEFEVVEELLENRRAKYSYNSFNGIFRFVMPTFIHASCNRWITEWVQGMVTSGDIEQAGVEVLIHATLTNFKEDYNRSAKDPDAGIYPRGRKWPTMALEAGYSESYDALVDDMNLLLQGTQGRIGLVIVVKIEPLAQGETDIYDGFVQVYEYDQKLNRSVTRGRRKRLYPPPSSRSQQCLNFTWTQLLRNKIGEHISDSEQTPPLYLEDLRAILDENIARHLAFKYGESDDSERD
ncbi:hypothetical protein V1525DRAFT_407120 [Lipomyces kononenkoae]|uniref:Uncharacterized protein n=1 Tax=Lipomyces kononenkoae TaxID=34357 RepID=A0ACC3SXM7_LIPKO